MMSEWVPTSYCTWFAFTSWINTIGILIRLYTVVFNSFLSRIFLPITLIPRYTTAFGRWRQSYKYSYLPWRGSILHQFPLDDHPPCFDWSDRSRVCNHFATCCVCLRTKCDGVQNWHYGWAWYWLVRELWALSIGPSRPWLRQHLAWFGMFEAFWNSISRSTRLENTQTRFVGQMS